MRLKLLGTCFLVALSIGSVQAQTAPLETTTFVVMGEGLAAGMANFGLSSIVQSQSFPQVIATQMKTAFTQPLIQPPGIGDIVGYPGREAIIGVYPQGTVRIFPPQPNPNDNAPPLFVLNTSIPGHKLSDALTMRPVSPVIQRNDMKQTVFNMILGFPQLFFQRPVPLWTQFEYAKALFPTVTLIELGFYEALDAAIAGDATRMPDPAAFAANYTTVVRGFRRLQSQVIVTTIPNPVDTAYFATPAMAAPVVATFPGLLTAAYSITPQDYITRNGMQAISTQFWNRSLGPLPAGSILTAADAANITNRVNALNAQIINIAKAEGAVVYDLNAFFRRVRTTGVIVGTRTISADYLGGFYSLDAIYPGATGHALIANDILTLINSTYKTSFALVNPATIAATDPTMQYLKPNTTGFSARSLGVAIDEGQQ
ncbi:MAG: hypothetical protein JWN34_4771 [Bryobacterales bacterium]|nr:hypothetical protein [Bryobacterales bacterium]